MGRTAGILGVTVPALVFAIQFSTYVAHGLGAGLGPSADELRELGRSVPDRVQVLDLTAADRRRKDPQDVRVPLPAGSKVNST